MELLSAQDHATEEKGKLEIKTWRRDAAQKQTTCCLECFTHNIVSRQNVGEIVLGHTESKSMFNFSSETRGGGGSVQLQVVGQWDCERKITD